MRHGANTVRGSQVFQTSEQVMVLIEGSDIKIPDCERAYQLVANNSQPIKPCAAWFAI
jgi:hypothetical protein